TRIGLIEEQLHQEDLGSLQCAISGRVLQHLESPEFCPALGQPQQIRLGGKPHSQCRAHYINPDAIEADPVRGEVDLVICEANMIASTPLLLFDLRNYCLAY